MVKFKIGDLVRIKRRETHCGDTLDGFEYGHLSDTEPHNIVDINYEENIIYVDDKKFDDYEDEEPQTYFLGPEHTELWYKEKYSNLPSWF